MAQTETMNDPRNNARVKAAHPDDEIVITGISGKFPNAENVEEFAKNLYNKVNKSHLYIIKCCEQSSNKIRCILWWLKLLLLNNNVGKSLFRCMKLPNCYFDMAAYFHEKFYFFSRISAYSN